MYENNRTLAIRARLRRLAETRFEDELVWMAEHRRLFSRVHKDVPTLENWVWRSTMRNEGRTYLYRSNLSGCGCFYCDRAARKRRAMSSKEEATLRDDSDDFWDFLLGNADNGDDVSV